MEQGCENQFKIATLAWSNLNTQDCVVDLSGFNRGSCGKAWVNFYLLDPFPPGEVECAPWEQTTKPEVQGQTQAHAELLRTFQVSTRDRNWSRPARQLVILQGLRLSCSHLEQRLGDRNKYDMEKDVH